MSGFQRIRLVWASRAGVIQRSEFCPLTDLSFFDDPATFEEIGQACVFLASDGARYINGQSILSDGGMNRAVR